VNTHFRESSAASALRAASKSPLLSHHVPGQRFDIMQSKMVDHLVRLPEVRQWVFNFCKRHGAIVWDEGRWRGVAYKPSTNGSAQLHD
jgi:hypothetical protein